MEPNTTTPRYGPQLVGWTGDLYQGTIADTAKREASQHDSHHASLSSLSDSSSAHQESNHFKSAQWSPDGTTLLTSSADNTLRAFILPPSLLSPPHPHLLQPHSTHTHPTPIYSTAIHPAYTLASPPSTIYLTSAAHLPIRLLSPLAPAILSSYPLLHPQTETYTAAYSLLFPPGPSSEPGDGAHITTFFAGTDSAISVFDLNRNGEAPVSRMRTIPSRRKKVVGGGVGMKGCVSAMAMSAAGGVLAAGTFGRWVGLYDGHGRGGTVGVFSIAGDANDGKNDGGAGYEGGGITQTVWSACGRYLYVAERVSDGVLVYDVRVLGRRVGWLRGRQARSQQRLGVEVWGREVWAGGTDGVVRVWEGVAEAEGVLDPCWEFRAHDDPVASAVLHPSGTVLATCSGQRRPVAAGTGLSESGEESGDDRSSSASSVSSVPPETVFQGDNSLKVWAL